MKTNRFFGACQWGEKGLACLPKLRGWLARVVGVGLGCCCLLSGEIVSASTLATAFDAPYTIERWDTGDGLPEDSLTGVTQTKDGYLWFGTFRGLVRSDGYRFKVFTPKEVAEMPHPGIVSLFRDQADRVWISTLEGIVRREASQSWTRWDQARGWTGDYVRSWAESARGELFLSSFNGKIFQAKADRLVEIPHPSTDKIEGFRLAVDESGLLWAVQKAYFGTWDGSQWRVAPGADEVIEKHLGLAQAAGHGVWLVLKDSLRKISQGRVVSEVKLSRPAHEFWSAVEDSRGQLWLATIIDGLERINTATGETVQFTQQDGLPYDGIRSVFEDKQGSLWIGASSGGLVRFREPRFRFLDRNQGLPSRVITSVAVQNGTNLLAASFGQGVVQFDGRQVRPVPWDPQKTNTWYVQAMAADRLGRIWIGTHQAGLHRMEGTNDTLVPLDKRHNASYTTLFVDSQNRIWTGMIDAIGVVDERGPMLRVFDQPIFKGPQHFFGETAAGDLLVACNNRLIRVAKDLSTQQAWHEFEPHFKATYLYLDAEDQAWIGHYGEGLVLVKKDGQAMTFGPEVLPISAISAIIEDAQGSLWLAGSGKILQVNKRALLAGHGSRLAEALYVEFNASDGLLSTDFASGWQPSCARDSSNRLWFVTSKGVAMVDPAALKRSTWEPPLNINRLAYSYPERRSGATREASVDAAVKPGEIIRLPPGSQRLEMHYSALDHIAPEKVRFQVRLQGMDTEWIDVENQHVMYYHGLAPGAYRFEVWARNSDGVRCAQPVALAFTITPYLWQTGWFRWGGGLGVLSLCLLIFHALYQRRWRHQQALVAQQQRLEHQLRQSQKMEAIGTMAGGIAHDFNNMLTCIMGNVELSKEDLPSGHPARPGLDEALAACERARSMVAQMLTFSRRREQQREVIPLAPLAKEAVKFLRSSLPASIEIQTQIAGEAASILADPTQIHQVMLNLGNNAAHAMRDRGGTLKVELQTMAADAAWIASHPEFKPGAYVRLSFSDTGHGMDAATQERMFEPFFTTKAPGEGTGLGLAIVHGILRAHEGIIQVYSHPGQGSTFHLYFPVVEGDTTSLGAQSQDIPQGNGQIVMVVDDEPAVLGLAKHLLVRLHYRPQTFLHPLEAAETFRRDPDQFQMVLTDLTMPKLSGWELARQIHQIRPDVPIILSTGFSGELTQEQSRQAGISRVLRKPYNIRELAQALHASRPR